MIASLQNTFDAISFLHQNNLLGQVDNWRRTLDGNKIYTLLTTVDDALKRVKEASKLNISRTEFLNNLKLNDIYLFENNEEHISVQNKTTHLYGFDFVTHLHRHSLLGMLDDNGPIYGLLVPLETALLEINYWSGQDINRGEFLTYLKRNDVYVFNSIDDFVKAKEQVAKHGKFKEPKPKLTRQISDEKRETLRKRMLKINRERSRKEPEKEGISQ
jgi:hypothetical protein